MARKAQNRSFPASFWPIVAVCVLVLTGCSQSGDADVVEVEARINGEAAADSSPNDPIEVSDAEPTELELTMTNTTDDPVEVRYVRFEGRAIDMVFLTYDTTIGVELAPGENRTLPSVSFDFFDLGGQATGYLRGDIQLYDPDRELVGVQEVFLDAKGDGFSTLAWFNLLLLLATGAGVAWNLMRLAQRRLPSNRFVRALRFLAVGAGGGLTLAVAFSTLRLWPLDTFGWVVFLVIGAVAGYAIGFVLPGADDDLSDLLDDVDPIDPDGADETLDALDGDDRETIRID